MKQKMTLLLFFLACFLNLPVFAADAAAVDDARIVKLENLVQVQQQQMDIVKSELQRLKSAKKENQQPAKSVKQPLETWRGTTRLAEQVPKDFKVLLTGYGDLIYKDNESSSNTFDENHFNLIFLDRMADNLLFESEVEYEHGGTEIALEYGQIDWLINDYMTLVAGKFLLPFGAFNERLHPTWINKGPDRPLMMNEVIPVDWADVGIQFRGNVPVADFISFLPQDASLEYGTYIVNGLQGAEGASLRSLRAGANLNTNNNKSYGGRIGLKLPPWAETGVSLYHGAYTADVQNTITSLGVDGAVYFGDRAEIRGEWVATQQEVRGEQSLQKDGWYVQGSYKLSDLAYLLSNVPGSAYLNQAEVVLRAGGANLDSFSAATNTISGNTRAHRFTMGLNYYIKPQFIWRIFYEKNKEFEGQTTNNDEFLTMLTVGL